MTDDADALSRIAERLAQELIGPATLSRRQIAAEIGMDLEQARRLWRALGFPPVADDDVMFTTADAAVLAAIRWLITERGTSEDVVVQQTRVVGQALARVADAQVSATAERASARTDDGAPITSALQAIVEQAPQFEQFIVHAWRRHLIAASLRLAATPSTAERAIVVGFADLSGFTAIQPFDRRADARHHGRPLRGPGLRAHLRPRWPRREDDRRRGDVRGRRAAAGGRDRPGAGGSDGRDADLPNIRVGLAVGPVLAWEGDLFGPTVNLASRLANFARPGAVLVSDELGALLGDDDSVTLRHLRPVRLKGVGDERPWVLRRAA